MLFFNNFFLKSLNYNFLTFFFSCDFIDPFKDLGFNHSKVYNTSFCKRGNNAVSGLRACKQ